MGMSTSVGFYAPKLPTVQRRALQQNTIARAAKLQDVHRPQQWRMEDRPGIYAVLERDLAARALSETTATWGPKDDMAAIEAAELQRIEKLQRRRAVQRPANAHLTLGDRKNCQQSALAADKQFVLKRIDEISENAEAKEARIQVLNDRWLKAVMVPIQMPGHYSMAAQRQILGPEIFKRLPPPLAEHQKDLKATYETADGHLVARFRELPLLVLPQRAIDGAEGKEDKLQRDLPEEEAEEFNLASHEVASIINVCRQFQALTASRDNHLPEVLSRAAFCRLTCAFDGFRSQGRPRLRRSITEQERSELYAHTFVVLKGENLLCQLMEPEVLCLMPEMSNIFRQLFEAYADLPMPDGTGGMSLKGLLRCCCDFDLFPDRVDYKTILWIYNSAEGCKELGPLPEEPKKPPVKKGRTRTWSGSTQGDRTKSRMKKAKSGANKGDTSTCILYHGKWIKDHLAWMTKTASEMTSSELRAIAILTAAARWMECQCLTSNELLAYFDDDGNAALSSEELSTAIQFMSFEDPPTQDDIEDVYQKLLQPKAQELDLETIGMAMTAVSKKEEHGSAAASVMIKDMAKMSKEQTNAATFFREMIGYLQKTSMSAGELFQKLDEHKVGALTGREITLEFRLLVTVTGGGSPALQMDNAFLLMDPLGIQKFTKSDFTKMISQVKKAERVRAQSKSLHPLFLTTADAAQGQGARKIFGPVAFMESMLKIGLEYLSYHGNATQQALPSSQKLVWLLAFLTWSFEANKQRANRPTSEGSRCHSRCSERAESRQRRGLSRGHAWIGSRMGSMERPYPRFLPPLNRLLARHPGLFLDALKESFTVPDPPEWATDADLPDVLLQQCTDVLHKEREHKESIPFHRVLLKLAAEGF
ncbi:unnamed protein product [Effrenium voratum]|nr:unnamed protein product [Effrenium voratum]